MNKKVVFCHFSFRRPRGKDYGIFAAALYADSEGKIFVDKKVRAYKLWQNHQHITAIQAYEHAMKSIWEWQSILIEHNVTNVLLVTDNSILAGWIADPKKNKVYTPYMNKANNLYKIGGAKEIVLSVGLCEPRDAEKSHKFCKEELVTNKPNQESTLDTTKKSENGAVHKLDIEGMGYKTAISILDEDKPSIEPGIKEA